jgi:hypothetical protein
MISAEYHPAGRRSRSLAALERDAALVRVSRTRRWLIAGAAGLSAGIAALVSSAAPGHTLSSRGQPGISTSGSASAPVRTASAARSSRTMPPLASPGELGLQGPSSAPQAAPSVAQASPDPSQSAQAAPNPAQAAPAPAPTPAPVVSGGS